MPIRSQSFIVNGVGSFGKHREIIADDGRVQYGGDIKGFFSTVWNTVKPLITSLAKNEDVQKRISGLIQSGVEKGMNQLANKLEGGCVSGGCVDTQKGSSVAEKKTPQLSKKGQAKLDKMLGFGLKYL